MTKYNWKKVGKSGDEKQMTVSYQMEGKPHITVESRRRQIPHANGIGSWTFTSYFVVMGGYDIAEKNRLIDAEEYAEKLEDGEL